MDGAHEPHIRMPPQSIDAEQAVLGGLMIRQQAWDDVSDLLTEADFYQRRHQLIWRAIKHLQGKRKPFDALTIGDFLRSKGYAEDVEDGAYLVEVAKSTPSAANIVAYAEIVREKAILRQVIEVGTGLVNDGFHPDGRSALEIAGEAQSKAGHLLDRQPCDLEPITPVMGRVFEDLQQLYDRGGGIAGIETGFVELDQLLNGLHPGLYVLAARPKNGKTTLAQNIAEFIALEKKRAVCIFSLEMQPESLGLRMLASQGHIDSDLLRRGALEDADWANVTVAMRKLRDAKIYLTKPKHARVEHICAQAKRQNARTRLGLVVIDYLQLIDAPGENRAQAVAEVSRSLALLAHEIRVPVLLLSQLNRKVEERPNKRPIPSDLRDSGAIEQDADALIFIYRDEAYNKDSRWAGTAEILVPLQRNGPAGELRLKHVASQFRFENLPFDWEPRPEIEKPVKRRPRFPKGNAAADAAAGDA